MQVLIVDDDDFALDVLEATLSRMGYSTLRAHDGEEALQQLRRSDIRLVVTDWDMPKMSGVGLCRAIRREELSGYIYIIMLTGREGSSQRLEGLCAGADDFLNKPLDPEELLVCLKTAERILSLETRDLALFALAKLAESRDPSAGSHVERVQAYSKLIAQNLSQESRQQHGVDDEYIRLLYQTSALHDLGKVAIPDAVLLKRGKLGTDEFTVMKTHTVLGAQTLEAALERFPNARFLQMARDIAVSHHEKFDGSGYPHKLVADQIPLCGRIVALADAYDALTSRRVYKEALPHERAKAIVIKERGSHFDPEVVDAFLRAELQVLAVSTRLHDGDAATETNDALPELPAAGSEVAQPCKILIVEDEEIVREKLVQILTATGEPVFQACSGEDALKILAEHHPRLVVSDWVMAGIDGVELLKQIRDSDGEERRHFIMLTAHSDKQRLLEAYNAGVDDFVSKPFDPEELLARVRAGLRSARLHDELRRKSDGSQALNAHLAKLNSRLERLSITDELTGLFNRRHAMLRLEEAWKLAERYGRPLTIAMIDVDHFKRINDTCGHDGGDTVLRQVAAVLREATRGTDALCRVGGEEFLIIFPQQTLEEALICAHRCRSSTCAKPLLAGTTPVNVSISIGVASRARGMREFTDLLKAADDALYAAKRGGRNLVMTPELMQNKENIPMPEQATSSAAAAKPAVDMPSVLKRCGGDPVFAGKVLEKFRAQAMAEVDRIEKSLATADVDTLRRTAHSLKSMTAYVSADEASTLARNIEDMARENRLTEVPPELAALRAQIERAVQWIAANHPVAA